MVTIMLFKLDFKEFINIIKLIPLFFVLSIATNSKCMDSLQEQIVPIIGIITAGAGYGISSQYIINNKNDSFQTKIKNGIAWGIGCSIPVACAAFVGSEESCLQLNALNCAALTGVLSLVHLRFRSFGTQADETEVNQKTFYEYHGINFNHDRYRMQLPNWACIISSLGLTASVIGLRVAQNYLFQE